MQRKLNQRRLSLEYLEARCVLNGELGADSANVLPVILSPHKVEAVDFYESSKAPDGQDKSLVIEVRVFGPFSTMARMDGTVSANKPGEVGRQVLRDGSSASFRISAFDLWETLENDGVNFADLARDRIYGSYVQVTETLRDANNIIDQRSETWSLYRYISAVFPDTPQIVFEPTAIERSNTKTIELRTYDAIAPTFVDPAGRLFDVIGGTGGPTVGVRFSPSSDHPARDLQQSLTLLGGWRSASEPRTPIGTINAQASLIYRRDWWIDEVAFANAVSTVYQMPPAAAKAMVARVLSAVNLGFKSDQLNEQLVQRTSDQASAGILVTLVDSSGPAGRTESWRGPYQTEGFRKILSGLNPAQESYEVGKMVAEYDHDNFGDARKTQPVVFLRLRSTTSTNREDELIKVIVHELGHAIGHTGHVTPAFGNSSIRPIHDVMQAGFKDGVAFTSGFDFLISQHYLRLFNGIGWNSGQVQHALHYIRSGSADGRRSTLRAEERGDFNLDLVVDVDDLLLWSSNFGRKADAPGVSIEVGAGDANGDGAVDGSDFLIWQRNWWSEAIPVSPSIERPPSGEAGVGQTAPYLVEERDEVSELAEQSSPIPFAHAVDAFFETLLPPLVWPVSQASVSALVAPERATPSIDTLHRRRSEVAVFTPPTNTGFSPGQIPPNCLPDEVALKEYCEYELPRVFYMLEQIAEEKITS